MIETIIIWIKSLFITKVVKADDINCPVCGYYCVGKGGYGCIDKLSIFKKEQKSDESEEHF